VELLKPPSCEFPGRGVADYILLVGPRDKPPSDNNYSTRVSNKDKHLDRRLSVNDLRHRCTSRRRSHRQR
jgi:hypothetical protein